MLRLRDGLTDQLLTLGEKLNSDLRDYWNSFYAGKRSEDVPEQPSAFASWARRRIPPGGTIWEFGFGTARDALWFSAQEFSVRAFDFAGSAVDHARQTSARRGLDAQFDLLDLSNANQVRQLLAEACIGGDPVHVYGRFLIHSLTDDARHNFFDVATAAVNGGYLFLEFRTGHDATAEHLFGNDHYRKYLDPTQVIEELQERGGRVVSHEEGHGLAVYKTEDPHVARLAIEW